MRAVVQRVARGRVTVAGQAVGEVGPGFVVLLGVRRGDDAAAAAYLADKVANLRVFDDGQGKMNRSLLETGGGALVISQFTLYGDVRRGRRPSYVEAASPEEANALYQLFCADLRRLGVPVATGQFQTQMQVELVNDGPVTILLDTERQF